MCRRFFYDFCNTFFNYSPRFANLFSFWEIGEDGRDYDDRRRILSTKRKKKTMKIQLIMKSFVYFRKVKLI